MSAPGKTAEDPRRGLPSVDRLARELAAGGCGAPEWARLEGARRAVGEARRALAGASEGPRVAILSRARSLAEELARPHPATVVNATGIPLHTNLGRAPLAEGAARAAAEAGARYGDLELDLDTGERGSRGSAVETKLRLLSGAGGAVVVNNNAAAVLLLLAVLARDRAAVVSRGELVEIGGSFRVPDIMASSGVRLIEVGTTNRTHLRDYAQALGPDTALLLKVHRSNFALRGFTAEVGLGELAELARERGLPLVEDLGSGTLVELSSHGWPPESYAPSRLALGADAVCFSGDKLLGGPQAGLILTREAELAERLRSHPLARALRPGVLTLSALDWTLAACLDGRAESELPALRQLLASPESLRARAEELARALGTALGDRARIELAPDKAFAGGGALPERELPGWVVRLEVPGGATQLASRLRQAATPVVGRLREGALLLGRAHLPAGGRGARGRGPGRGVALMPLDAFRTFPNRSNPRMRC